MPTWLTSLPHKQHTCCCKNRIACGMSIHLMNTELVGLTVDNRARAKVLKEQVYIQRCTGKNQFQCGDLLKHIPHLSEQEVSQTITLMYLVLLKHSKSLNMFSQ